MKKLFLFTATFPYGAAESFIETEILYLSKEFDHIVIIPLSGNGTNERPVPSNCRVLKPIIEYRRQPYLLGMFHHKTYKLFLKDMMMKKVYMSLSRLRSWIVAYFITNFLLKSKILSNQLNEATKNDIIYFYWGVGSSLLTPFLTSNKAKKVVRFHGEWDLWEESSGGYAAIRREIINSLDLAVFISKAGLNYFNQKYSDTSIKTEICYLGTLEHGISERSDDKVFRLLSCSSVIPLKRVHLIFEALKLIDRIEVEWTHIGDGIDFNKLSELSKTGKSNLKIKLIGSISNQDVLAYYMDNKIDAFINVSSTEGLPVTLMEAISFDVPIIAPNIGGISEIVNSETGILLSPNPSFQEIAKAILEIRALNLHPKSFWNKNFDAEKNYTEFITIISNLK